MEYANLWSMTFGSHSHNCDGLAPRIFYKTDHEKGEDELLVVSQSSVRRRHKKDTAAIISLPTKPSIRPEPKKASNESY